MLEYMQTKALVDGVDRVLVVEHFPNGSTSALYPHYRVRYPGFTIGTIKVASSRLVRADDFGVTLDSEGFPVRVRS